jgi:hypothetical protein
MGRPASLPFSSPATVTAKLRWYNSNMDSITFCISRNPGEGYCAVARGDDYALFT